MTTDEEKVYDGLLYCTKLALMYGAVLQSSRLITDSIVPVMAVQQESSNDRSNAFNFLPVS